ncbi:cellulose binding domain-containing protein [Solwaraspora sp. WMMD1047]|uniref:pectate lyase family protein n=1 Tax=Solwaraspora sp. WMMD1047 TaxID=3016102 RepID=UPI002417B53E|nr:cellulose binding domain-containing protein [Solwaraspora sp. WMMD1047]MDG4829740.1 cellulose binding domain-containing protein [Solwaraspora sp. WMMD1047]
MFSARRRTTLFATALATVTLGAAGVVTAVTAHAAAGCQVSYAVGSQWPGGFNGNVTITNLGDPLSGWTLRWSFGAGQQVVQAWSATVTQSGSQVTAVNVGYNGNLGTNASTSFGFNGSWNNSSNPVPSGFTLNGVACTGSVNPTSGPTTGPPPPTTAPPPTTPPPTTPPPTTPPPTTGPPTQPQTGLVGWATQNGGTTGGGNAGTTTVTNASALTSALGSSSAAVIRVSGTISCSGMLRVRSNKTILGNSGATISGCGFNINGDRNVIIRNLTFRNWNDDAINVQESATNIWIDHNSFTNGYDGAVDIKRGSDFITVSWNRVFGHDKSMLLGHSDDNAAQDRGHLRVSYHHNWFDGSNQRHPRVRFGNPVHVYNNLYSNVGGYGVASTEGAGVLVEGNYFENTDDPYHLGEGSSGPGSLVARNNHFVNSGSGQTGGSVAGIPYSYQLDAASSVKSIVTAGAGAGRITV